MWYGVCPRWALAADASVPMSAKTAGTSANAASCTSRQGMALLLDERTATLVQGPKRLGRRDGRPQLVEVPRTTRLGGFLHLEEIHGMDLPAILTNAALPEERVVGGHRLHLRDHGGSVIALERLHRFQVMQ